MKKYSLFIFLLIATILYGQDFRNSHWGDAKKKVKSTEKAKLKLETEKYVCYSSTLLGIDMFIYYDFINDKLVSGTYISAEEYYDAINYVSDYEKLKYALTEKYGKPELDDMIWHDELYKKHPSHYGIAVKNGHLEYYTTWSTDKTYITLRLTSTKKSILLAIQYEDLDSLKEINKEMKKRRQEGL